MLPLLQGRLRANEKGEKENTQEKEQESPLTG